MSKESNFLSRVLRQEPDLIGLTGQNSTIRKVNF